MLSVPLESGASNRREEKSDFSFVVFVIVFRWNAHHMSSELAIHSTLFWFCVYIRPHLVSRAMLDFDLAIVNFLLNVEILYLDVFSSFRAACFSVRLQKDSTHIILIQ